MTRIQIIFMAVIMAASAAGCGNSKETAEEMPVPAYIEEAQERFGDAFVCEPNAREDYILCAHRPDITALSPLPQVAFFVFDVGAGEVVHEQGQITGAAVWTSDYEIEMTLTPGIVTTDGRGAPKYKIDVRSGDRRRIDGTDPIPQ